MYRAPGGRFGTIPHVCSYEVVGERREVVQTFYSSPVMGILQTTTGQFFLTSHLRCRNSGRFGFPCLPLKGGPSWRRRVPDNYPVHGSTFCWVCLSVHLGVTLN